MTKTLIAALVAATALLAPAASQAATVSLENGTIVYSGEGAEGNHLLVSTFKPFDDPTTYLSLDDSAPQTIVNGPCVKYGDFDPWVLCPLDPSQPLRIEGSAGNDDIGIFNNEVPDAKPIQIHGNAGNDQIEDVFISVAGRVLTGGPGNDTVLGYGGNDAIDGGDGSDVVDGGAGNDQVRGGAGDDEMWGDHYKEPGADLLDGGPGTDTTEEWGIPSDLTSQPRTNVTLDGVANDGRPGEGDNVIGIERIRVSVVGDYVGTDGADEIKVINPGNEGASSLAGRGGNDILVAEDFDDAVDGGTGNDVVEGGRGNDVVTGGPGQDTIMGDATSSHCSWYSCQIPWGTTRSRPVTARRTTSTAGSGRTPRWSTRSTSSPTARTSTAGPPAPLPDRAPRRSRSRASRRSGRSRPRDSRSPSPAPRPARCPASCGSTARPPARSAPTTSVAAAPRVPARCR